MVDCKQGHAVRIPGTEVCPWCEEVDLAKRLTLLRVASKLEKMEDAFEPEELVVWLRRLASGEVGLDDN